jgi:hypothetical protein
MDAELQEMLDSHKIRKVLQNYCRGVDRRDQALLESVYWPDSVNDLGIWSGPGQEFASFVIAALNEAYASTLHCIQQSSIQVNGSRAAADTYCTAFHRAERDGVSSCDIALGRYVDLLEKRGDEWRILHRQLMMEDCRTITGEAAIGLERFTKGIAGPTDPSYEIFEKVGA